MRVSLLWASALLLSSPGLTAQFQPNHPAAHLGLDGSSGTASSALRVVKSICQPALVTLSSEPRLVGQPMLIFASPDPIRAAGHGALQTPGGQWFGIDPVGSIVLPAIYRGRMHQPLDLPGAGALSLQMAILDRAATDGFRVSAPGRILVAADAVVVARPDVSGGAPGRLQTFAKTGETAALTANGATPTGIAFGADGSTFFGRARHHRGLQIELFHRSREGVEKSFGLVVDTRGGFYSMGAQGFDLLRVGSEIFFTHPTVMDPSHQVREQGSIRALDPSTGVIRTVVSGLDRPSGLASDGAGNVYFGEVVGHPMRVDLHRVDPAGRATRLTTAWDSAGASIGIGLWGFDLALAGDELVYQVPVLVRGSSVDPGRIEAFHLARGTRRSLLAGRGQVSGLAFDARGGLYFAEVESGPSRACLFYRAPSGAVEPLGLVFECGTGLVAIGGWGLDLAVPCR